jgi:PAP2 superfamily
VQTVSLTWQHAGEVAGVLAVTSVALRAVPQRHVRWFSPMVFEAAIIGLLYSMWQLAGKLSVLGTAGALQRAKWIKDFDERLPLPTEHSLNHLILEHPLLVQAANLYYASMHFTVMFLFLIWLFVRHRDKYRPVRTTMAWTTFFCLMIQLVPVAPPRMLPSFVDTADIYNQSVYSNGFAADQLSAMPSVHVAWAVVVGFYAVTIGTSRWRWIALCHTVITILVVVSTANHWWLDGIVAVLVLVSCAWARYGVSAAWHALLAKWRPAATTVPASLVDQQA